MTPSEIVRRTDHDRSAIRAYLAGQRSPGTGIRAVAEPVRRVRRLRDREAYRGSAPLVGDTAGRVATVGFDPVLSDADLPDSGSPVTARVHGVRTCCARGSLKPVSSSQKICTTLEALPARFSYTGNGRTSSRSVHVLEHVNVCEYAPGMREVQLPCLGPVLRGEHAHRAVAHSSSQIFCYRCVTARRTKR